MQKKLLICQKGKFVKVKELIDRLIEIDDPEAEIYWACEHPSDATYLLMYDNKECSEEIAKEFNVDKPTKVVLLQ